MTNEDIRRIDLAIAAVLVCVVAAAAFYFAFR